MSLPDFSNLIESNKGFIKLSIWLTVILNPLAIYYAVSSILDFDRCDYATFDPQFFTPFLWGTFISILTLAAGSGCLIEDNPSNFYRASYLISMLTTWAFFAFGLVYALNEFVKYSTVCIFHT